MTQQVRRRLPIGLIIFMVVFGLGAFHGAGQEITGSRRAYEAHFVQFPALRNAVLIYQGLVFCSFFTAMLVLWILYKRVPGTLRTAIKGFVASLLLRILSVWVLFGLLLRLPVEFQIQFNSAVIRSVWILIFGTIAFLYLSRSKRVRETFQPVSSL